MRDISWDVSGCFVATCGDDGCVAVFGRRSGGDTARADEWDLTDEQTHGGPLRAVRLDPRYATRRERVYLTGSQAGALVRHTRGWFKTQKDVTVDNGEGAIETLAWGSQWAAWSNARGVKIIHGDTSTPVSFVPRPASSLEPETKGCVCALFWEDEHSLLLGWGDVVMLLKIKVVDQHGGGSATVGSMSGSQGALSDSMMTARAEVASVFRLDCVVCGLCPFDAHHIAVLCFPPMIEGSEGETSRQDAKELHDPLSSSTQSERPEFQVISREDGSVTSAEALPVVGYQTLATADYSLASTDEFDCMHRAATWHRQDFLLLHPTTFAAVEPSPRMRGSPPQWYVTSPRDVVVARVRDVDDVVDVALNKAPGRARDALVVAAAHAHRLKRHRVHDLVKAHLDALLAAGDFETAARECQRLLGDTETLWEYWVLVFDKHGALADLAPRVPTTAPRLARSVYDMILERLLATKPGALRDVLKLWGHPSSRRTRDGAFSLASSNRIIDIDRPRRVVAGDDVLYSLESIALRVDERSRHSEGLAPADRTAIVEARAELYVLSDQAVRALALLLTLDAREVSDPNVVFKLLDRYELYDAVRSRVADLTAFSRERAANLLVRRVDKFPIDDVARQLEYDPDLQLWYLRVVFADLPEVYASPEHRELHTKQVELYAARNHYPSADRPDDYDSELIRFLKWSTFVPFQVALDACSRAELYDEVVYVLGRMGDTQKALHVLLDRIGSVRRAVDFVEAHGPKDLWDILISHALQDDTFLCGLLDYAEVASRLVAQIPDRVQIPGLKHKLVRIFHDRRFQRHTHSICAKASKADCLDLLHQLYAHQDRGIRVERLQKNANGDIEIRRPRTFSPPGLSLRHRTQ